MNQTRSFLLLAWLFVAAWLFMEWNKAPAPEVVAATSGVAADASAPLPAAPLPGAGATTSQAPLPGAAPGAPAASATPVAGAPRTITLANDRLRLVIDLDGGRVLRAQLLQ